jgi:hypothetical protein
MFVYGSFSDRGRQDSSVGTVTSYRMDDRRIGVRLQAEVADSSPLQSVRTDSEVHTL